jgi:hypothetical protein
LPPLSIQTHTDKSFPKVLAFLRQDCEWDLFGLTFRMSEVVRSLVVAAQPFSVELLGSMKHGWLENLQSSRPTFMVIVLHMLARFYRRGVRLRFSG